MFIYLCRWSTVSLVPDVPFVFVFLVLLSFIFFTDTRTYEKKHKALKHEKPSNFTLGGKKRYIKADCTRFLLLSLNSLKRTYTLLQWK